MICEDPGGFVLPRVWVLGYSPFYWVFKAKEMLEFFQQNPLTEVAGARNLL